MTTKELIFAEIKRLIRDKNLCSTTERRVGGHTALLKLLAFLDTLPDESGQPTRGYDEAYLNEKIVKASKSWEGVDVDKFMDEIRGREPVTTCNQLEPVTDCHDLTKAAENSWAVYEYRESPKGLYSTCYVDGFIAGAEWGAEHLRDTTKKVSEDLEEAARECSKTIYNKPLSGNPQEGYIVYDPDKYDAFKAGAEWQKKQDEENYAWVKQLPNPNIEKLDGIEITTSDSSAGGKELLYVSNKSYNIGLRDGMAEQKRKMMEGAVEGLICATITGTNAISFLSPLPKELTAGSEVCIIILPKED